MKPFFASLLSTLSLLGICGCGNIELPPDSTPNGSGSEVNPPASNVGDAYGVLQLRTLAPIDSAVKVRGYIVGYAAISINNAYFQVPNDKPNTNMLLADAPGCMEAKQCIAVQLEKTGMNFRKELNLYDHNDFMHKYVEVEGVCEMYMGEPGVKRLRAYKFLEPDAPNDTFVFPLPQPAADEAVIEGGR